MQKIYTYYYKFQIGHLKLSYTDSSILGLVRAKNNQILTNDDYSNDLLQQTTKQLDEYFSGKRTEFDLPLSFKGTVFQKKVWKALMNIPYGETRSYKDIAIAIDNPKACRAVGGANNKNPIILICPCHRVIGASGKLVGYGGGMDMKEYLLDFEKSNLK